MKKPHKVNFVQCFYKVARHSSSRGSDRKPFIRKEQTIDRVMQLSFIQSFRLFVLRIPTKKIK